MFGSTQITCVGFSRKKNIHTLLPLIKEGRLEYMSALALFFLCLHSIKMASTLPGRDQISLWNVPLLDT